MDNILDQINPQALGAELRQARESKGLTQQDVAEYLGIARTTLVAIEKGERRLKASELLQLAQLYGKSAGDFLRAERPTAVPFAPQFRAAYRRPEAQQPIEDAVITEFEALCRDYVELENITKNPLNYRYPPEYSTASDRIEQQAETIAAQERLRLGVGDGPLPVMRTLLEQEVGLRIFYMPLKPAHYAGLYVYDTLLGGCIALNRMQPPERRRWSLAHEYAHFLAHRAQVDTMREDDYQRLPARERFADAFAKHFLMPASSVGRQIGSRDIARSDLFLLAQYFGVSVQAMTLRLEELGYIPQGIWDDLQQRGIRVQAVQSQLGIEPVIDPDQMLPIRYQVLAVSALEDGAITEGLFARFLRVSRAQSREIRFALEQGSLPRTSAAGIASFGEHHG